MSNMESASAAEDGPLAGAGVPRVRFDAFTLDGQDFTSVEVDLSALLDPVLAGHVRRIIDVTCANLTVVDEWAEERGGRLKYCATYAAGGCHA